jgi:hypothetical protein
MRFASQSDARRGNTASRKCTAARNPPQCFARCSRRRKSSQRSRGASPRTWGELRSDTLWWRRSSGWPVVGACAQLTERETPQRAASGPVHLALVRSDRPSQQAVLRRRPEVGPHRLREGVGPLQGGRRLTMDSIDLSLPLMRLMRESIDLSLIDEGFQASLIRFGCTLYATRAALATTGSYISQFVAGNMCLFFSYQDRCTTLPGWLSSRWVKPVCDTRK